jgi:hypothetical protein
MKENEEQLRTEPPPYTVVLQSGERVKVRSHDHIDFPPTEDEDGRPLDDAERTDFFKVWGNGQRYRWVAFKAITTIEGSAPKEVS